LQPKLAIADYLAAIASELLKAQAAARQRGVSVMQFAECEIEFAVEVEGAGESGIEMYVVKLGGSVTKRQKSNTNTVGNGGVKLNPRRRRETEPLGNLAILGRFPAAA
jgi:L,D-peptidoglycan transpeptidase YkuD (ErfK/YbiS/YcfS/YnhG family)